MFRRDPKFKEGMLKYQELISKGPSSSISRLWEIKEGTGRL